jgi:hypothetical protein
MLMKNIYQTLQDLIRIVGPCPVTITDSNIITPIGDVSPILFAHKSKLENQLVDLSLLQNLIIAMDTNNSIVRLNHIGFGYRVKSQQQERLRLIALAQKTDVFLYEEESNDFGLWLFLGNTGVWENPLIEFVPVEKVDDPDIDYYLPHIQIDIDTTLTAVEIEKIIKTIFGDAIKPYHVAVINGITYIVRNRLGVVDGVNIFLDLATNSRNVKYHRQNILKKIS